MTAPRFPDAPERILRLPVDHRGFPVPWFVAWIDGKPDFRVVAPGKIEDAVNRDLCWICGHRLGDAKVFTIGPMCAINRVSSEPPAHLQCATFAAKACPFLCQPRMRRNEKGLPADVTSAGVMIRRNPGVALVWVTRRYKPFSPGLGGGVLFELGTPTKVYWWAEGREATRAEVVASIDSGFPLLMAEADKDGPKAVEQLRQMRRAAMTLLPAEATP